MSATAKRPSVHDGRARRRKSRPARRRRTCRVEPGRCARPIPPGIRRVRRVRRWRAAPSPRAPPDGDRRRRPRVQDSERWRGRRPSDAAAIAGGRAGAEGFASASAHVPEIALLSIAPSPPSTDWLDLSTATAELSSKQTGGLDRVHAARWRCNAPSAASRPIGAHGSRRCVVNAAAAAARARETQPGDRRRRGASGRGA